MKKIKMGEIKAEITEKEKEIGHKITMKNRKRERKIKIGEKIVELLAEGSLKGALDLAYENDMVYIIPEEYRTDELIKVAKDRFLESQKS